VLCSSAGDRKVAIRPNQTHEIFLAGEKMNFTKYPVYHLTEKEKILLCVFNFWSMALGLLGNVLVVTMLNLNDKGHKGCRAPSTIILKSLAVSDILVITIVQPLYVYSFFHTVNANISQGVQASRWALVLASLLHLLVVSIDRFLAICKPNYYHQKLKHTCTWCITSLIVVWCFILFLGIALTLVKKSTARPIHGAVAIICLLILISLFLIHIRLFIIAVRHRKKIEKENEVKGFLKPNSTEDELDENKQHRLISGRLIFFRELKAFKTTSVLCGAFLVSWLPLLIMGLIYMTTQDMNKRVLMLRIFPYVNTLAFLNSTQNPFIYSIKIYTFKKSLRKFIARIGSLVKLSTCN
jgi:hypothetical protein